ncbi:MAG: FAD-binding oxidoreductase [Synergistaceae bacterium]|jgi:sarcosine oxidase subunit beta|nr:FAD-binding oxidoreductase [Synergistaceae bacterium]NLW61357.1 FAD-binding oxidoreductase [Synergistaceae bacterium]
MTVKTTDFIIVGGGVHGASTAYQLAKAGHKVTLFETRYLGAGGSGRSAAGLRQHFGTEVNCLMAKYNIQQFPTLEQELDTGMDLEFRQWGYMWVAYKDSVLDQLQKNVDLQVSLDIPSEMLTPEEIHARWPYLCLDGIIGAAFCGEDGHINPQTLTLSYGHAARRHGAVIKTFCPVKKLLAENGKIKGVVTEDGEEWHADKVLLAAGAWTKELALTVGVDIPVYPERHNLLVSEPVEVFECPMVLCMDDGAYFKQCANGTFLFGRDDQDEPRDFSEGNSAKFLEGVTTSVMKRMPALRGARVVRQWSGPYDNTPDHNAIIDWTPVEGLLIDCGWSGHGLQFGPSAGFLCKQLLTGEKPFVDIHRYRLARFAENDLFFEPAFI